MQRRYYKKKSPLKPIVENIGSRLKRADSRIRRSALKYSLLAFVGFVIYSFMAGPYGFFRISRLEDKRDRLIVENKQLLAAIVDADITRKRLVDDPHFIEYVARTRYLMSKPGEITVRVRSGKE